MWLQTGREGVAPMRLEVSLIAFYCGSCDPGEGIPRQQKLPEQENRARGLLCCSSACEQSCHSFLPLPWSASLTPLYRKED